MPDLELILAASAAFFVASFTPGPNNAICVALGAAGGFKRALPFSFGVAAGFPMLIAFAGLGLGGILAAAPQLHLVVKICGALFLLRLAWKIATAKTADGGGGESKPFAQKKSLFLQAVLFQWINPKGITVSLSMVAAYARPGETLPADVAALMAISAFFALASTCSWTLAGMAIRRRLKTPASQKTFNRIMAILLTAAIPPVFFI